MTEQEYYFAWLAYLFGGALAYLCFWRFTAALRWVEARQLLRLLAFVFLAVPWQTNAGEAYLSPAWFVAFADTLMYGPEAFWRAGMGLIVAMTLTVLGSLLVGLLRWGLFRRRSAVAES